MGSTTLYEGAASRAVDGGLSGFYSDRSVTHTDRNESEPWWQVDLGENSSVGTVVIWNREQEPNVDEVQRVTLRGVQPFSQGEWFRLNITINGVTSTSGP